LRSRKSPKVGDDPWDARTLEWTTSSPPPEYNFAEIPIVTSRDEAWHRKYAEDEHGRPVPRAVPEGAPALEPARLEVSGNGEGETLEVGEEHEVEHEHEHEHEHEPDTHEPDAHELHIHMPSPSYYPLLVALGIPIICYGLMYKAWYVSVIGALITLASVYGWVLEPATEPDEPEEVDEAAPEPEPEPEAELEPAGS
jgi:cytochrome c oxidase subunit I